MKEKVKKESKKKLKLDLNLMKWLSWLNGMKRTMMFKYHPRSSMTLIMISTLKLLKIKNDEKCVVPLKLLLLTIS
jgi:hypothetical protein